MNAITDSLLEGPLVVQTQGYTPHFWKDRNVLFFANLQSMFFGNEEQTELMTREIGSSDSYGGRLAAVLGLIFKGGDNTLVLERNVDHSLMRYLAEEAGLTLPRIHLLSHEDYLQTSRALKHGDHALLPPVIQELRNDAPRFIDGYVTDETLASIASHLGCRTMSTPAGSKRGNNKYLLHQHLEESGLPVFDTRMAGTVEEIPACIIELKKLGYDQIVVKSQIGASGIGLVKLWADTDPAFVVPALFFHEGPCMVQGWLRPGMQGIQRIYSPSVQLFLDDENVYLYDLTEQILSEGSVHEGNESPPPYLGEYPGLMEELFRQADVAGSWLHRQGYRGTASADFVVCALEQPGTWRTYVCELNARVTGATYPSVIARHFLPRGAWLMRNLQMDKPIDGESILQLLRARHHLFHPHDATGILPVNFNLNEDNLVEKGQFLCLGSTTGDCHAMLRRAREDLPVGWKYVRD